MNKLSRLFVNIRNIIHFPLTIFSYLTLIVFFSILSYEMLLTSEVITSTIFHIIKYLSYLSFFYITFSFFRTLQHKLLYPILIVLIPYLFLGLLGNYYWDSINTVSRSIEILENLDLDRVVLLYYFFATLYRFFLESVFLSHLGILIFTLIAIFSFYYLAKYYRNSKLAIYFTLLFFFHPGIFLLSKWIYLDIPLIASVLLTFVIALLFSQNKYFINYYIHLLLIFCGMILMVLMKEYGIIFIPSLIYVIASSKLSNKILNYFYYFLYFCLLFAFLIIPYLLKTLDINLIWDYFNATIRFIPWDLSLKNNLLLSISLFVQNLTSLTHTYFLFPAIIGLIRFKSTKSELITFSTLLVFTLILLFMNRVFPFDPTFPFYPNIVPQLNFEPFRSTIIMLIAFLSILAWLHFNKIIFFSINKLEKSLILWIFSVILLFSLLGHVWIDNNGQFIAGLDWRYPILTLPPLILLTMRIYNSFNSKYSLYSYSCLISLIFISNFIHLRNNYLFFQNYSDTFLESYRYLELSATDNSVVYTTWPYILMTSNLPRNYDIGYYSWNDAWEINFIDNFDNNCFDNTYIIARHSDIFSIDNENLFSKRVFNSTTEMHHPILPISKYHITPDVLVINCDNDK